MPLYLAGRTDQVEISEKVFQRLKSGLPAVSVAFSGYRGVGKTVLLNHIEKIAKDMDICCYHMEIRRDGAFLIRIIDCCKEFLTDVSGIEKMKASLEKAIDAIKSLEVSFSPESNTFSLSAQDMFLYTRMDLSQSLENLFESIGPIAQKRSKQICFFIDEFQYADPDEMDAFLGAIHRASQLNYPIIAMVAGTPEMVRIMYDKKTYVERLFIFPDLHMLNEEEVAEALSKPADIEGIKYCNEALEYIYKETEGYPYFVQQYGQAVFERAVSEQKAEVIDENMAKDSLKDYYRFLDENFYKVRFEYRGDSEKELLNAIAKIGAPCTMDALASELGKNVKSIAPIVSKLKAKGIISNQEGINFTVPGFDKYLKRSMKKSV